MRDRGRGVDVRMIRAGVVAIVLTAWSIGARAQNLTVAPSFGTTELYDSNVFYKVDGGGDTITRFTPGVDARYGSERLVMSGHYVLDADRFAAHPELNTVHGRQDGGFDAFYQSSRRLSLGGMAAFIESRTPADLNQATGLTPGRVLAQRVTLQPSATYQLDANTDTQASYTLTSDRLAGGVSLLSQSATTTLDHRLSDRNDVRVEHVYERYLFDVRDVAAARTSQTLTIEWTHAIDRATSVTLRSGPRVTDGAVSPEIAASIRRRVRAGEASLAYQHTQATVIGLAGTVETHSVTAAFTANPHRRFELHAAPAVLYTRQGDLASMVYRLSLSCARPIASRLSIEAAYDANLQRGNVYSGQSIATIDRNVALLKLVVAETATPRRDKS